MSETTHETGLRLGPNLPDPDGFYAELIALHEGLSREDSEALNARLVLVLANHIGRRGDQLDGVGHVLRPNLDLPLLLEEVREVSSGQLQVEGCLLRPIARGIALNEVALGQGQGTLRQVLSPNPRPVRLGILVGHARHGCHEG